MRHHHCCRDIEVLTITYNGTYYQFHTYTADPTFGVRLTWAADARETLCTGDIYHELIDAHEPLQLLTTTWEQVLADPFAILTIEVALA